jgi:MFS family permease
MAIAEAAASEVGSSTQRRVIVAASLGTVFEWYDFYLYGTLASTISKQFFAGVDEATGFILALLAFAVGFAIRPLGAILFGRLGDIAGRKYTFLVTITVMGVATALVGVLPVYATAGLFAPCALIALRMLQGLALGGEYGGAAVYVAEHSPAHRRGRDTGWINGTATIGLLLSFATVYICRALLGAEFDTWGWRIPFLLSLLLLGVSLYVRLQLAESPVFRAMVSEGTQSKAPLREALTRWQNLKLILAALFGACLGATVTWYASQLYALFFLTQVLKLESQHATLLIGSVLLLSAPLYATFGAVSDRVGRKPIVLGGCVLAILLLLPVYRGVTHFVNPALETAIAERPVTVIADPAECRYQFDPIDRKRLTTSCDVVRASLTRLGIPYRNESRGPGPARVRIGENEIASFDVSASDGERLRAAAALFDRQLQDELLRAGYPAAADPERVNEGAVVVLLILLLATSAMTYGPLAAWLVELFPSRICYTSLSVPYHFAVGWFGGFLPAIAFMLVASTGDMYRGLWYPIGASLVCVIVGALFLPETRRRSAA